MNTQTTPNVFNEVAFFRSIRDGASKEVHGTIFHKFIGSENPTYLEAQFESGELMSLGIRDLKASKLLITNVTQLGDKKRREIEKVITKLLAKRAQFSASAQNDPAERSFVQFHSPRTY